MEPKIYLLDSITPETKNWTAKVYVVNKTEPRTSSQPTSIRFQKLLLADNKGNRVEGMVYRGDIELLKNSLRLHQTYLISNAIVRPVKPGFENPLTNNKDQLILGARTPILATEEDALILYELAPTFTHSDHFRDFVGTITLISAAAIIIDGHARRTVTAKGKQNTLHEYAAVDEQLRYQSDLLIRGKLARTNQNFIYPCCAKCHRLTIAAYGHLFECHSCHEIRNAIPRFRFSLLVYDDSGKIEVTVFDNDGEKIMQMSAPEVLNKYCNDESLIFDSINSILRQLQLKMKIQSKVFYRQDGTTTLSHTMQTLECLQLTSSGSSHDILLSS
ncbi:hypothetical protein OROMI_020692 [Orobanche minor]